MKPLPRARGKGFGDGVALLDAVRADLEQARSTGWEVLAAEQRAYLDDFWQHTDVQIEGRGKEAATLQRGVRFNLFHLLQSTGRDGRTNIAAKGLTGEGYEGHYFWDTEIYMLPFFVYTNPQIARRLLEFRYNILDDARQRAREMAHPSGALFPWRTISGPECSPLLPRRHGPVPHQCGRGFCPAPLLGRYTGRSVYARVWRRNADRDGAAVAQRRTF